MASQINRTDTNDVRKNDLEGQSDHLEETGWIKEMDALLAASTTSINIQARGCSRWRNRAY
jgi:hypothetical protein